MTGFDLRSYLDCYPSICKQKFGRTYDLGQLERQLAPLRSGSRPLACQEMSEIFDPNLTPFARYWPVPDQREIEVSLARDKIFFGPSPPDTRKMLGQLMNVFHNLGVISLVLRFVYPDYYGVFSTPVINLLQVQRSTTIEVYVAFCEELKAWKEHFDMLSIAQTEMALWAYDQVAKAHHGDADKVRQDFSGDVWCLRRRVAQVVTPFLRDHGKLELARILAEGDAKLAGKIAGEEYERLLGCASQKLYHRPLGNETGAALRLISDLEAVGWIRWTEKIELNDIWRVRNRAVHPHEQPEQNEVEDMIDKIERICVPWGFASHNEPKGK